MSIREREKLKAELRTSKDWDRIWELSTPTTALPSIDRKPRSKTPMSTIVRAVAVIDRVLTKLGNDDARRRVVRMVNELVAEPLLEGIQ